jgi:hypothetical protein
MKIIIDPNSILYYILEVIRFVYPGQLVFNKLFESDIILVS